MKERVQRNTRGRIITEDGRQAEKKELIVSLPDT